MTAPGPGEPLALTTRVVAAARALRWSALREAQRCVVARLLLDGYGVMYAGLDHPTIRSLAEHVRELGCAPAVRLPELQLATAPQEAALVLGAATHVLDFEPMFSPPTHAVSPVLGAVLALARREAGEAPSGERVLEAFSAGVVLQAALRVASVAGDGSATSPTGRHFPFQGQGFHLPGILGVLGSALSSSLLLGLDDVQTARALGIAASRAAGVAANIGTMTKALHSGNAARAGVESALLAARGFTGSERALEAPSGWIQVFADGSLDAGRVVAEMEVPRCLEQPGFAFKRWPAHSAMQVAIAAALPLHQPGGAPRGAVQVVAPELPYCDRPSPADADEARFSFQLNVALALLDGAVSMASYDCRSLRRPELRALLDKVELSLCPAIPRDFSSTEVRVELADGRRSACDRWPGHWKAPATDADLREKFLHCVKARLDRGAAEALHERLTGLPTAPCARSVLS